VYELALETADQETPMDPKVPTVAQLVGVAGVESGAAAIVMVKLLVVVLALLASVTRTVTVCVEAADGVPRITPVVLSIVSPVGRDPAETSNV
jgi:hypothetical protein